MKQIFFIASLFALFLLSSCSSSDDFTLPGFSNASVLFSKLDNTPSCKPGYAFAPVRNVDVLEVRGRTEVEYFDTITLSSFDIKYCDGDTLSISHNNVLRNCGSYFEVESFIDEVSKTIIVNEIDKRWESFYCQCNFDIKSKVGRVKEGDYRLVVTHSDKSLKSDNNFDINSLGYSLLDIKIHFDKNLHRLFEERLDDKQSGYNYHLQEVDEILGYILEKY